MPKSEPIGYAGAHHAVARRRGKARKFDCVDCENPAREWSYDHSDPDEFRSSTGKWYSTDIRRYEPRCRTCHVTFDRQHRITLAEYIAPLVKHAIAQRNWARRHNDRDMEDFWDDELERLVITLVGPNANA